MSVVNHIILTGDNYYYDKVENQRSSKNAFFAEFLRAERLVQSIFWMWKLWVFRTSQNSGVRRVLYHSILKLQKIN